MISTLERIEYLRKGRAHHTWLGSMGIARDTIKHIKDKTAEPSETVLSIISKCENASFIWLTEGEGTPYRVALFEHDGECADALAAYLSEEAWVANVIDDSTRKVIVLTLETNFQRARGGFIEYTAIEVLTEAGIKSVSEAAMHASAFRTVMVDFECMDDILAGEVGTYQLLGDAKTKGILSDAQLINMSERLLNYSLPGTLPDIITKNSLMVSEGSPEYELVRVFHQLDTESQNLLISIAYKIK